MLTGGAADHFEQQAAACEAMGSPFTAHVCRSAAKVLDHSTRTGASINSWSGDCRADALALRLCGAFHALALGGRDAELAFAYPPRATVNLERILRNAVLRHDEYILHWLANPPQTNETARASALLPGFLAVARRAGLPLELAEIGSSAGLNLFFDRFRYRFGDVEWGDPAYPTIMAPEMRGAAPDLSGEIRIADRRGNDIAPLAIGNPVDRLRLRAYVWPDQPERLARLDAAIAAARAGSFVMEKADAAKFVLERLKARKPDACFVLFHSVVWQYLPESTKAEIESAMEAAGKAATPNSPMAWLRLEGLGGADAFATLQLRYWPGGETETFARADFHVRWLDWLNPSPPPHAWRSASSG